MSKLVSISDTHGFHRSIHIPECDILIHAGDISSKGEYNIIQDFSNWLDELKSSGTIKEAVVIAGNHELSFDPKSFRFHQECKDLLKNVHYLEDASVDLYGLKIYGSPYTPEFCNWGFNLKRGRPLKDKWALIPNDTNVLVTHGPPMGIGDYLPDRFSFRNEYEETPPDDVSGLEKVGCQDLMDRIMQLDNLKVHIFGHIHYAYGIYDNTGSKMDINPIDKTLYDNIDQFFVNSAICSERYRAINKPIVIEFK